MLAGFLAMLWLVPFDLMAVDVSAPIDLTLDRVALAAMGLVWFCAILAGGAASPQFKASPLNLAIGAFAGVAILSVLLNAPRLANLGEYSLAVKKLALLAAFIAFFYIVVTVIRPSEVPAYLTLSLGLAVVAAAGTIWEYRTGTNYFYQLANDWTPPKVIAAPDIGGYDSSGRPNVNGPTGHGLAIATALAMILPFALTRTMASTTTKRKVLHGFLIAVLIAGCVATIKKSAVIVPAAALIVLVLYRPRAMIRLLPAGVLIVVVIHFLSPGALGSVQKQLNPSTFGSQISVQGRTRDYATASVDVGNLPAFGRGFGTYDPDRYRFLDNQYLMLEIESGYFGLAFYLLLMLTAIFVAHRVARSHDRLRGPPAMAIVAAVFAYGISNLLFDTLAFPHAPYLLFFVAGLAVVLAAPRTVGETMRTG